MLAKWLFQCSTPGLVEAADFQFIVLLSYKFPCIHFLSADSDITYRTGYINIRPSFPIQYASTHVECITPTMMLSLQPPMNGFDDLHA